MAAFNLECNICPALRNLFPITLAWMSQHSTRRIVNASFEGPSVKLQAASIKLRATSFKPQAASGKLGATSIKLQAASYKLADLRAPIKFPVARDERLYQDICTLRMLHMKRNLVW